MMKSIILCAAYVALMPLVVYAEPQVPKEPPVSATTLVICSEHGPQLVSLIVTFADGKVLRVDMDQMHGFTSPQQIMAYGETAKDKYGYYVKCKGEVGI